MTKVVPFPRKGPSSHRGLRRWTRTGLGSVQHMNPYNLHQPLSVTPIAAHNLREKAVVAKRQLQGRSPPVSPSNLVLAVVPLMQNFLGLQSSRGH